MPKKNKQPPSPETQINSKRARTFAVELYPEWENVDEILGNILHGAEKYAYITHDKDIKEDGIPKKPHIHVYVHNENGSTISAYAKRIGIEQRFIQPVNNHKGMLRYLIHIDDPDKHQYDRSDIHSNFDLSFAFRTEKNEGECVLELLDFAMMATRRDTIKYAVQQNLYDVLRRNWNIIFTTKDEETQVRFHNEQRIRFQSITREEIGRIYDSNGREVIICKNGECYGEAIE